MCSVVIKKTRGHKVIAVYPLRSFVVILFFGASIQHSKDLIITYLCIFSTDFLVSILTIISSHFYCQRHSTIEVHPNFFEAPHFRSSILVPHPKTDSSKIKLHPD